MKALVSTVLNKIPRPILLRISQWIRPLIQFYYRGNTFTDPIDGKNYSSFLPYGYLKQRDNVLSPGTLSLERHRLLWLYLKNETNFFESSSRVLHIAPEQAFLKRFKKLNLKEYITVDIESPLADVKADVCHLPFDDQRFDWIFCNHVLEHIQNDTLGMKEIFRVLKPKGIAILQIPLDASRKVTFSDDHITDPKERALIFGQYDHVRVYGMDYFTKLSSIGFEVEAIQYAQHFTKEDIERYRISNTEYIPVCRKP